MASISIYHLRFFLTFFFCFGFDGSVASVGLASIHSLPNVEPVSNGNPVSVKRRDNPFFPEHQIKCQGELPKGDWHAGFLSDFTYKNPRELCALPAYGGNAILNAGLRCNPVEGLHSRQMVVIQSVGGADVRDEAAVSKSHPAWSKIISFCLARCSCLRRSSSLGTEYPSREVLETEMNPPAPYEVIPIRPDPYRPPDQPPGVSVQYVWNQVEDQGDEIIDLNYAPSRFIGITKAAPPSFCGGQLPPWLLPNPFNHVRFENTKHLCMSTWDGGNALGNAGLQCIVGDDNRPVIRAIDFLAHPALSRSNYHRPRLGLAVEFWCRRACGCSRDYLTSANLSASLLWINDGPGSPISPVHLSYAYFDSDGRVSRMTDLHVASGGRLGGDPIPLTPKSDKAQQAVSHHRPGSRIPYDKGNWRDSAAILGGIGGGFSTCGGECTGPRDCSGGSQKGCRCVVTQEMKEGWTELDSFVAQCVTVVTSLALPENVRLGSGGLQLGGRSVGPSISLEEALCPCNATFVARACCDAMGGII